MPPTRSLSARNRRFGTWKRDRRGATLIIIAVTCVVMLGFVGVGVDFARAYAFRTRVKTVADAAAMAGGIDLAKNQRSTTHATALAYAPRNFVEGQRTAAVSGSDVKAAVWDFNARRVDRYVASFTDPAVNAVEVTARYNVATSFGRVFNVQQIPIVERTVAAVGGVGTQDCLRPWAVSYKTLLDHRFPPSGPPEGTAYNLNQADISWLGSGQQEIRLLQGGGNITAHGNIAQVATWKDEYASSSSNAAYTASIRGTIPCEMMRQIGPGTELPANPGVGGGATVGAIRDFCEANGGATGPNGQGAANGNRGFLCTTQPSVKLAMWSHVTSGSGANPNYVVKYVAVFKIKGYQPGTANGGANGQGTCGPANVADQICGFFSTMATSGAFTGGAGMTQKPALVL
jgi:Flp pilus assembly protein TadG